MGSFPQVASKISSLLLQTLNTWYHYACLPCAYAMQSWFNDSSAGRSYNHTRRSQTYQK